MVSLANFTRRNIKLIQFVDYVSLILNFKKIHILFYKKMAENTGRTKVESSIQQGFDYFENMCTLKKFQKKLIQKILFQNFTIKC